MNEWLDIYLNTLLAASALIAAVLTIAGVAFAAVWASIIIWEWVGKRRDS